MDAAVNSAITHLLAAVPTLDANEASSALEVAVPITVRGAARFLEELVAHLCTHPDAMGSGDSRCPPVLIRLTHVLHDNGHQVIRPGCAHCGKTVTELRQLRAEGRICGTCDSRSRLAVCSRCGQQDARIAARRPDGKICYRCYNRDPERFKECSQCGRLDRPVARLDDETVVCQRCWKRPERPCIACGQVKPTAVVDDDGAYCHPCYSKFRRPRRTCGRCGKLRHIARNATEDQPDLCHGCYRGPEMTCSICDRVRPCKGYTKGKPICQACYRRPTHTCCRCGKQRGINAHWPMGPVCDRCYDTVLRSPAECGRCRTFQPLIARDEEGAGICGPCAGFVHRLHMPPLRTDRIPLRARRLRILCARQQGPPPAHRSRRRSLRSNSCQCPTPSHRPTARSNRSTGSREAPTHGCSANSSPKDARQPRALDELPPNRNVHYIRQMMVQTGVLPERHEDLERLPAWLDHHLLDKPTEHANLIRPYLHWFLLRRARRRAVTRNSRPQQAATYAAASSSPSISWTGSTATESRWINCGKTTSTAGSAKQNTQRRQLARYFLKWTHQRGLSRKLVVPTIPRQQPAELLDDDERWQLLQRCLTDDGPPRRCPRRRRADPAVRPPDRTHPASHRRPAHLPG